MDKPLWLFIRPACEANSYIYNIFNIKSKYTGYHRLVTTICEELLFIAIVKPYVEENIALCLSYQ